MDPATLVVGALGILGTVAAGWRKRSEGLAAKDQASAAGILALIAQIEALNTRCNTLEGEVNTLRADLERSEDDRLAEREMRQHFERLAAERLEKLERTEAAAIRLKAEYEARMGLDKTKVKSERPGPTSQKKA